jgi:hypothetical protein
MHEDVVRLQIHVRADPVRIAAKCGVWATVVTDDAPRAMSRAGMRARVRCGDRIGQSEMRTD